MKLPNNKYKYETTTPISTTITREAGPKYIMLPKSTCNEAKANVYAVKEPCYLLQAGGNGVVLCADLSVYDPNPQKQAQKPKLPNVVKSVAKEEKIERVESGLVMEKGTEGARRERRSQRRQGVTRVYDWRRNLMTAQKTMKRSG